MEPIFISNMTSILNQSEDYCFNSTKEDSGIVQNIHISLAVICFLEFLVGITANGYVIWMKVYRLEKTFRSVLSLNLFIAGLLWSLFLLLNIVYFAMGINWPFGSFMCQLNFFIFNLNMLISSFILSLYSVDYCFVVLWPLKYNVYRRPHLASIEALIFWIISISVSIPFLFFKTTYECYSEIKCFDRFDATEKMYDSKHEHNAMAIISFTLGYLFPLLIMTLSFIITAIVYHRKKTSKYTSALKMIFTFQILFGACWLPYHVLSLIKLFLLHSREENIDRIVEIIQPIMISLVSVGSVVNPILYALLSPDFKKKLPKYRK